MFSGKKWVAFLGITFLVVPFFGGTIFAADTVNFLQVEPVSGAFKDTGDRATMAVQFAVDEFNAAGGLNGKKIQLLVEDSQLKPDVAARKATKAILENDIKVIILNTGSAVAKALNELALKHKVIFVNVGAESDFLTGSDGNRYVFRTCFTTGNRSRAYAEFFKTQPWRKFYLMNQDYAMGHSASEDFKKAVKKEVPDLKIVGEDFAPMATKDFGPYITKIIAAGPEIIFTGNWGTDLELLLKQGAQLGVKARYATYFMDDHVQLPAIGKAAVGSFVNSTYSPAMDTPQNKAHLERWHNKFKETKHPWPTAQMGYSYNGTKFLLEAIKKAGTFDADAIINAWEGMEYVGLMGKQLMRACDHQVLMPGLICEIQEKSELFPFPFPGKPLMVVPMDKVAVPIRETGNPRCR